MTDEERENKAAELEKAIKKLPEEAQRAMIWAIDNMQIVKRLCMNSGMTRQELEKGIADARAEEDYMKLVLLSFARFYLGEE